MWILPVPCSLILRKERRIKMWLHWESGTHTTHHLSSHRSTHWHTSHRHTRHWHSHSHATIHASTATSHVWSSTHIHAAHVIVEALVKPTTATHALLKASHLLLWLETSSHATHLVALKATTEAAAHVVHASSESTSAAESSIEASIWLIATTTALDTITPNLGWHVLRKGLERVDVWV